MAGQDPVAQFIDKHFESHFVEPLSDFVRIPNLTPEFDPEYFTNGLVQKAIKHVLDFADSCQIAGLHHYVHTEKNVPPMVCIVVDGTQAEGKTNNVLLYGHVDKQPHMNEGWTKGLGPLLPIVRNGKLYGRGVSDDGYASFAALLAIKALQINGKPLPRMVICLETEEESGSESLLYLLNKMKAHIRVPDICICLDSGALDYNTLWLTSSLRGNISFNIRVESAEGGLHSGLAGGVVPDTFTVARNLLDRIENSGTAKLHPELCLPVPDEKRKEALALAKLLGPERLVNVYKLLPGVQPYGSDLAEIYLNNVWHGAVAITGADGLPKVKDAGNVLRQFTELRVCLRLPPAMETDPVKEKLQKLLTNDPPQGCKITIKGLAGGNGWVGPPYEGWQAEALAQSSQNYFGKPPSSFGVGGSIPFLDSLGRKFPNMSIIALGVCGPDANAHNPDENLDLGYARKFIKCLSHLLAAAGVNPAMGKPLRAKL